MPTLTTRATKGSQLTHNELDANFVRTVTQQVASFSVVVSDNRSMIECSHATVGIVVTLGDAATMVAADTGDFEVTISNANFAAVTIARAGSDTINGGSANIVLQINESVILKIDSTGTNYQSVGTSVQQEFGEYQITSITAGTGSITVDTANNTLAYIKQGRLVWVQGTIDILSVIGPPTGLLTVVDALPFTSSFLTEAADQVRAPCAGASLVTGPDGMMIQEITGGAVNLTITLEPTFGAAAGEMQAGSQLHFAFFYITD